MSIAFARIIIVMLENATRDAVLRNTYMSQLRHKGVFLSNSYGITHPSQPNYIAMIGGDTFGFNSDDHGWVSDYGTGTPSTSIVDLIEARPHMSWKAYAEDLQPGDVVPSTRPIPPDHGCFVRRHVPFLSYPSVVNVPERAKKIVNAESSFLQDLANDKLPHFAYYTPGLVNDGHSLTCDGGVSRIDADDGQNITNIASFLEVFLSPDPIAKFPPETLIVLTFDEAYPYDDDYNVYTLLIGDMLEAGTTRTEPYDHYSLLRSVEENFQLGSLARGDASACPYWFLTERC
jgi:hypothetical protein